MTGVLNDTCMCIPSYSYNNDTCWHMLLLLLLLFIFIIIIIIIVILFPKKKSYVNAHSRWKFVAF
jgi:nitrogen fixation protein FixH